MATELRSAGDRRDAIRGLIASAPSRAVDMAIETAARSKGGETSAKILDLLAQAVYATRDLDFGREPATFKDLGRRKLKSNDRRYVLAVLLRLFAANPQAVSEDTLRRYFRDVFESLPPRLVAGLDMREDTFEHRLIELPGITPEAERKLEAVFRPFESMDDLRRFQSEFMRELQHPSVAAAIRPFLSNEAIEGTFGPLVKAADRCRDLGADDAIDRVHQARHALDAFLLTAESCDCEYGDRYLLRIADVVSTDLERRFADSPLSQPASLTLRSPRKRFPLHLDAAELNLQLEVVNEGGGPARDVRIRFEEGEDVGLLEPDHRIPAIGPKGRLLSVPALVMRACDRATVTYEIEWTNTDGAKCSDYAELNLKSQNRKVDWEKLEQMTPYPSGAITDDRRLVGRDRLLDELAALVTGPEVGSTRVIGEKRVGKSSLVRSLKTRLERLPGKALVVVYIDVNKLGTDNDAQQAMASMMSKTARSLQAAAPELAALDLPPFDSDPVARFSEFLDDARERLGDRGILVIVDEFDEMPDGVFARGGAGDAFFRVLKAFSSDGDCGFLLVGSERLELVLGPQSDRLNAVGEHRVDYIKADQIDDFIDLVERPVTEYLEIDRDAIAELHELTAGHPFYTVMVCREIVDRALASHDNHVTTVEMREAYDATLRKAPATSFAHIWFDYVYLPPDQMSVIIDRRLRLLLAWSACLRSRVPVTVATLADEADRLGLETVYVREELNKLVVRSLAREENGEIVAKSPFVEDWLRDWGPERISVDYRSPEAISHLVEEEKRKRVGAGEIRDLRDRWPHYQSKPIEADDIRAWIDQFPDAKSQRLAFKVLDSVRFESNLRVRQMLQEVHAHARSGTTIQLESDKRHRREFALVYLDGDGNSASLMTKQYAHANKIFGDCVVSATKLESYLKSNDCQRVVVVDDLIGTGMSAIAQLGEHADLLHEAAAATGRNVVLGIAFAFQEGLAAVEDMIASNDLPVEVAVGEVLLDGDRCFHEKAGVFADDEERLIARQLFEATARTHGAEVPRGAGDALLVFEHSCPAVSVPLLWRQSDSWVPLFVRTAID